MNLFERLSAKAKAHPQKLVLPESTEPRTLQAADKVLAEGMAEVILIGNREEILGVAGSLGLSNIDKATICDPTDAGFTEKYAELFAELRKRKGVTIDVARNTVRNDSLYLGCLMIKAGDAD